MKIKTFHALPDFMLKRFIAFDDIPNEQKWSELYTTFSYLKSKHPDQQFKYAPMFYVDLTNKTNGYIFIEKTSSELYYVYE